MCVITDTSTVLLMGKISKKKKVPAKFVSARICPYAEHSRALNTRCLACTLKAKQTAADFILVQRTELSEDDSRRLLVFNCHSLLRKDVASSQISPSHLILRPWKGEVPTFL